MSIHVKYFKWEKGKNDLEYITLLENNLDALINNLKKYSKIAKEQYNKGYANGRTKTIEEVTENIIPTLYECDVDEETINECKRWLEQMKGVRNERFRQ